jgi:hypothetical protein
LRQTGHRTADRDCVGRVTSGVRVAFSCIFLPDRHGYEYWYFADWTAFLAITTAIIGRSVRRCPETEDRSGRDRGADFIRAGCPQRTRKIAQARERVSLTGCKLLYNLHFTLHRTLFAPAPRHRRALVRNVCQVHASHELEQFPRDMLRAADAGRGLVQLSWIRLGVSDELGDGS